MEDSVTLFGASGHGKVIIDILKSNSVHVDVVIDDNPKEATIMGVSIIKTSNINFDGINNLIISIGNNKIRKKISHTLLNVNFTTAIHLNSIVSEYSNIGNGTVIMAGAIINPDVVVGNHCIINTGAIVEHDCVLENFVHISPGAALAGNVSVGEGSHIGIGACIIQGVKIGKWVTIGAGAVVLRDIPDYAIAVGNPSKIIKFNDQDK
ncbi:MAG: acetyltransferase [Flavobacterium sp.]